jgi:hypothetical protein
MSDLEAAHVMAHASDKMITAARKMEEAAETMTQETQALSESAATIRRSIAVQVKMSGMTAKNEHLKWHLQSPVYSEDDFTPLLNEL